MAHAARVRWAQPIGQNIHMTIPTPSCGVRNGDFACLLPPAHTNFPMPGFAEHSARWRDDNGVKYTAWWSDESDDIRIEER